MRRLIFGMNVTLDGYIAADTAGWDRQALERR